MDEQELQPCVTRDKGSTVVIVAQSKEALEEALERYFRDLHPARHAVEVESGPGEKDGTWKIFLKKFKCR